MGLLQKLKFWKSKQKQDDTDSTEVLIPLESAEPKKPRKPRKKSKKVLAKEALLKPRSENRVATRRKLLESRRNG